MLNNLNIWDGTKASPTKMNEVIKNYPRPTTLKQIQSFLGLCSYFRRCVNGFSKITKPMTTLLKKGQPFIWTNVHQDSFEKLKKTLMEEVMLAFRDFNEMFYCTTDASDYGIAGMLSQGTPPNDRPIYFFSKTLNEAHRKYSTIHKDFHQKI